MAMMLIINFCARHTHFAFYILLHLIFHSTNSILQCKNISMIRPWKTRKKCIPLAWQLGTHFSRNPMYLNRGVFYVFKIDLILPYLKYKRFLEKCVPSIRATNQIFLLFFRIHGTFFDSILKNVIREKNVYFGGLWKEIFFKISSGSRMPICCKV